MGLLKLMEDAVQFLLNGQEWTSLYKPFSGSFSTSLCLLSSIFYSPFLPFPSDSLPLSIFPLQSHQPQVSPKCIPPPSSPFFPSSLWPLPTLCSPALSSSVAQA
jgi:hypothetical protein